MKSLLEYIGHNARRLINKFPILSG